jgi:hypothetical protein
MKGAVLHQLGLNMVKERIMRSNYGFRERVTFVPGVHPESSRYTSPEGKQRSNLGVIWVAYKVRLLKGATFNANREGEWPTTMLSV